VEAMKEIGIDISGNRTKSVSEVLKSGQSFATRLHWGFPDPSALQGTQEEKLAKTREIRDQIRARGKEWCAEVCAGVGV